MKWFVVFSIIFVGNLPATITAATTDSFFSLFDVASMVLGWTIAFTVLELWNQYEFRKELEEKFKH